jgi:hypothetical protein
MDINAKLRSKAQKLDLIIADLRETQIVDESEYASFRIVEHLRQCVKDLDNAVSEIEYVQDGR